MMEKFCNYHRKMGFMWGIAAGFGAASALTLHWVFAIPAIASTYFCYCWRSTKELP